jgi:hypothetical protein
VLREKALIISQAAKFKQLLNVSHRFAVASLRFFLAEESGGLPPESALPRPLKLHFENGG